MQMFRHFSPGIKQTEKMFQEWIFFFTPFNTWKKMFTGEKKIFHSTCFFQNLEKGAPEIKKILPCPSKIILQGYIFSLITPAKFWLQQWD